MRQFSQTISHDGERYVVCFPKRPSINQLPSNLDGALQRLKRKLVQLQRDPEKCQRYHTELMKFVSNGFACEVTDFHPAANSVVDGSYYMPHHEVITSAGSSEKWRGVFDCSSKLRGATSLYDHLLPGPNLNPDLVSLLLNFRLHPVAVSADIAKAYMLIAVDPTDQPLFRFLWRAPDSNSTKAFQMQRVTWGAASSGFLLAATLRHHLQNSRQSVQELAEDLYADDF